MESTKFLLILWTLLWWIISIYGQTPDDPVLNIATVISPPWVMTQSSLTGSTGGNFTGFLIDLLTEVAAQCRFRFQIHLSRDHSYGKLDYATGEFGGIIGELNRGEADLGVADLIVSESRRKIITFTTPFASDGAQILLRKPSSVHSTRTPLALLRPFTPALWCLVLATPALVITCVYVMGKFITKQSGTSVKSTIAAVGTACPCQGYSRPSLAMPTKVLLWWFRLVLIVFFMAYASSLVNFLLSTSLEKPVLPFKSFAEMADQTEVEYGGVVSMRLNPNYELHRKLTRFMNSRYTYFTSTQQAVDRLIQGDDKFAIIVDGLHGEYLTNSNCDLLLLREQLFHTHYAMACPISMQGEELCSNISVVIGKLQESGVVDKLMKKWWYGDAKCPVVSENDFVSASGLRPMAFKSLDVKAMVPVWILLGIGAIMSFVAALIERRRGKLVLGNGKTAKSRVDNTTHVDLECSQPLNAGDQD